MGYCPQNDALFDQLTVNETFEFYLKIKIRNNETKTINNDGDTNNINNINNFFLDLNLNSLILKLTKKFGLEKFRKTQTQNLSGGNKRKLNFAIALMHNPNLILLDEPSTGVDPESRRIMWKNINEIPLFTKSFNMILSTHSMEEAEILCDTIGWMKNGNFLCVGNPEKLKIKYSPEYYIFLKFKNLRNKNLLISNNDIYNDNSEIESILKDFNYCKKLIISDKVNLRKFIDKDNLLIYKNLLKILKEIEGICEKVNLFNSYENNSFDIGVEFTNKNQAKLFGFILNVKVIFNLYILFFIYYLFIKLIFRIKMNMFLRLI
jgi:ABC-type multidrug transport system ATPase subunit